MLTCALLAALAGTTLAASGQSHPQSGAAANAVDLNWTPAAMADLSAAAAMKSSFTLDRNLLALAAGMVPSSEPETRRAINKIDGVSVHVLRFGTEGMANETEVAAVREAYHRRGWKHMVTTTDPKAPLHDNTADVWVAMDGTNVRGSVVLVESPKSLTLVTVAGNLSPIDLLRLRGHFGIPRFDGSDLHEMKER